MVNAHFIAQPKISLKPLLQQPTAVLKAANVSSTSTAINFQEQFTALSFLVAPDCKLKADTTNRGRGLIPLSDIDTGQVLLSVDWVNLLCVADEPQQKSDFSRRVLEDWQLLHGDLPPLLVNTLLNGGLTWAMRMAVWLLWLRKNAEGVFRMYIDILPKEHEITSLMMFTKEERIELQDNKLISLSIKEYQLVQSLHDSVFSSNTGQLNMLKLADTPSDTFWALSMVNSRSFSETVDGELVSLMVPCADMANHMSEPNCEYRYNVEADCFQLVAKQALFHSGKDIEACINYGCGSKNNAELMKDYGFLVAGNINDRISFNTGDDVASQLSANKTQPISIQAANLMSALGIQGYSRSRTFELVGDYAPHILLADDSEETIAKRRKVALLFSLQPFLRDFPQKQSTNSNEVQRVQLPSSAVDAECASIDQLIFECESMLVEYPTSIEDDEALLAGDIKYYGRLQAALAARLEIKYSLRESIKLLKAYRQFVYAE